MHKPPIHETVQPFLCDELDVDLSTVNGRVIMIEMRIRVGDVIYTVQTFGQLEPE